MAVSSQIHSFKDLYHLDSFQERASRFLQRTESDIVNNLTCRQIYIEKDQLWNTASRLHCMAIGIVKALSATSPILKEVVTVQQAVIEDENGIKKVTFHYPKKGEASATQETLQFDSKLLEGARFDETKKLLLELATLTGSILESLNIETAQFESLERDQLKKLSEFAQIKTEIEKLVEEKKNLKFYEVRNGIFALICAGLSALFYIAGALPLGILFTLISFVLVVYLSKNEIQRNKKGAELTKRTGELDQHPSKTAFEALQKAIEPLLNRDEAKKALEALNKATKSWFWQR